MTEPFRARVAVRGYELDVNGHLNWAHYLHYAEHARWECLRAAGLSFETMVGAGLGPVNLEANVRFLRELRDGDEVGVSCEFEWGDGKTFRVRQQFTRLDDGALAAEVTTVSGVIDQDKRRLIPDPAGRLRSLATSPHIMGL
ncbi:MAG TPA: thioesterase family protein [Streptosporangiaceae bacterium]|jgi:acyl-CoA thioester hydrolase|nr:thioesterase family protein [Streptosporangiaceae bacterium]